MDINAATKLTKARAGLILDNPFFGSLALRLKLVELNAIPTLAVDGKHIFYNAKYVNNLSLAVTKAAIAHEVMHCVWSHIARRGSRHPMKWNIAGDFIINDLLKTMKDDKKNPCFELGSGWLLDPKYTVADWTVDRVYNDLPDPPPDGGPGVGEPGGPQDDCMDAEGGTQTEAQRTEVERDWKVATIQAANSARMQGKFPAELERFLDALFKPQVNWVEKLREFIDQVTKDDFNWTRRNKRFEDVYLPALHNETMGEIVVVVDDSGSIDNETLQVFGSEIKAIMEDCRPAKTHLVFCDAAIHSHYELEPDDVLPLKIHDGGGTDFRPPFDLVEEKEITPMCLIYLTDLCGPWHENPPVFPVLWVCTTDIVCPWGETVHIEPVGEK
jgi:predicted metal-dependent peptidase